jgi:NAD(P)-dependent dehydrogenase (short-subunit alcohol dehydrogenase family)
MTRLAGKVALVTGAAHPRSIGWGIARALAEAGADIIVNDIAPLADSEARAAEIRAMGRRAFAVQADVADAAQVQAMFARAVAALGRIDIVASNAGIIRWEPVMKINPNTMHAIVAVNIKGNVNVCRAAAQQMIAQGGGGRIIITSSVQSDTQFTVSPVYGATKAAMHIFVGCLAAELAPHQITVNHIGPGWVASALNDPTPGLQTPEGVEEQRQAVPLKRAGEPLEMGRAVAYLASSDAGYVTGAGLRVDGGLGLTKFNLEPRHDHP